MAEKVYFAIDWGATFIKAGLVNNQGQLIKKVVVDSQDFKHKEKFISKIKLLVKDFSRFKICGVGVGVCGVINYQKGSIFYLPNVSGWENFPLKQALEKALNLPVFIENDACLFALAESRLGAAKGKNSGIFLTLGTGLGGSVILNSQINSNVLATELGHVSINLDGQICGCGGKGCIETFVGSNYLIKRYNTLNSKEPVNEVKDIFLKAKAKDPKAILVWQDFSYALGRFLGSIINIFNPQVIVLGGGVSGAFSLFKPLVLAEMNKQAMLPRRNKVQLFKAKLEDPGIIGAAVLVKENLGL